MGLKDNVKYIKDELNNEEKFFENIVKAEKFLKKYKKILILLVSVSIVAVAVKLVYDYKDGARIKEANTAYRSLLSNGDDVASLDTLKRTSKPLYDGYLLSKAIKDADASLFEELINSESKIIGDIAKYELALINSDDEGMNSYAYDEDFLLNEMALVVQITQFLKQGKIKEANELIKLVDINSNLYPYIQLLKHYGVTKQ